MTTLELIAQIVALLAWPACLVFIALLFYRSLR